MSVNEKISTASDTGQVSEAQMAYLKQQSQHRKFVKAMRISIIIAFFFLWEVSVRAGSLLSVHGAFFLQVYRSALLFHSRIL